MCRSAEAKGEPIYGLLGEPTFGSRERSWQVRRKLASLLPQKLRRFIRLLKREEFYLPLVDVAEVERDRARVFDRTRPALGIDVNDTGQLALFHEFVPFYSELPFPDLKHSGLRYYYLNPSFPYPDATILYSIMRRFRPNRIVEFGCGFSSCVMLDTNERFLGGNVRCTFVDPHPQLLRSLVKPGDLECHTLLPCRAQDTPLSMIDALEENDILFIDSTHVMKTGSDVNHLLFEAVPRLKPGVIVHFHDVFWPFEYPETWVFEQYLSWNELYAVRAFLLYNTEFEVLFFTNWFQERHEALLRVSMPLCLKGGGGSLWLRRRSCRKTMAEV